MSACKGSHMTVCRATCPEDSSPPPKAQVESEQAETYQCLTVNELPHWEAPSLMDIVYLRELEELSNCRCHCGTSAFMMTILAVEF